MDYIRNSSDSQEPGEAKEGKTAASGRRLIDTDLDAGLYGLYMELPKTRLVNFLNLKHFRNETVRIHFFHPETERRLELEAIPQPCFGKYLLCLWRNPPVSDSVLERYRLYGLSFSRGTELVNADVSMRAAGKKGICLVLPEKARLESSRLQARYSSISVRARILQNGAMFRGELRDFNSNAFCVILSSSEGSAPLEWLNPSNYLTLMLESGDLTLYSGECRVFKNTRQRNGYSLILEPLNDTIQRFPPRQYRSRRVSMSPSPDIIFRHPLSGGQINLKALDISGAGISVQEPRQNTAMIAGLIIPELTVNFSNAFRITCRAQVAYTRTFKDESSREHVKCGIVFLDMDPDDHVRLMSLIHQAENSHSYICNPVDIDSLWEFFFETGFIYPKKYAFIRPFKEEVKRTYEKLYACQSPIARHFTWQDQGRIIAHLAMLRFYERTWLIHHLAARTDRSFGKGAEMVDQIGAFAYETHRLASSKMSYLICYYRPSNRFPAHFFGGAAARMNNPQACSVDEFAYSHVRFGTIENTVPEGWSLSAGGYQDLEELRNFYEAGGGGRMLSALDLIAEGPLKTRSDLSDRYHEIGLWRERRVFALRHYGEARAVIMANISNFALNLSDLTNCITVFVLDPQIPAGTLRRAVSMMDRYYAASKVPVLIYPVSYAEKANMAYDRTYCLWSMDMQYTDDFFSIYNSLK